METIVKERIRELLSIKEVSITALSKVIQVPQSTLNRQINTDAPMTINNILLILNAFEDISAEWLLLGQGPMCKSESTTQEPSQAEERIDTKSTINVLIKTIEYYQKEVDRIMDNINELRKENEILKIELERKKAVGE